MKKVLIFGEIGTKCWDNVKAAIEREKIIIGYSGLKFSSFPQGKSFLFLFPPPDLFYSFSSGNGGEDDNCNYDMYANAPFVINVGAHTADAQPAPYSEHCSSIVCFCFILIHW